MAIDRLIDGDLDGSGIGDDHAPKVKEVINECVDVANRDDRASVSEVDLKDGGATDYEAALGGDGTYQFIPTTVLVKIDAAVSLNADATIAVGTTAGGTDVLAATAITGATDVGKVFPVPLDAVQPLILDNATLYVSNPGADTGTSGEATVIIEGRKVAA